jgi:multiple sugar transport system permease protein
VRTQRRRENLVTWLIVGPWAIVLAFPFYWMLWTSLKTEQDLYNVQNVPFSFSNGSPTLDNVRFLFEETDYARWLWNTVVIGVFVVAITLLIAAPAGYALARLSGRWGQSLGVAIFMVYLVPPTLLFLPLSRLIVELGRLPFLGERGLQDQIWSLVVVYPSFTIPFSTWLLMGFFKSIPRELEEAALVDGASRLAALRRIVLPVSLPGLLTVVIFAFSLCVNEFVYAVSFITTKSEKTISTGVYTELIRGDVFYWGALMAATLIPAIPLAILYNVFLDRFIAGFTGGAFR